MQGEKKLHLITILFVLAFSALGQGYGKGGGDTDLQIETEAKAIKNLALSYPDSANGLLQKLIEKYPNPSPYSGANILKLEGAVYLYERKFEQAQEKFNLAFESYKRLADEREEKGDTISLEYYSLRKGQAQSIHNAGAVFYYRGKHVEAIESYLKAVSLHEHLSHSPIEEIRVEALENMATTKDNIGRLYKVFGQLEKALTFSLKAYEILNQLKTRSLAGNMLNIAYLYKTLGKIDSSFFYAQLVRSNTDSVNTPFEYYAACTVIAETYAERGDYDEALKLVRSVERYKDGNSKDRTFYRLLIKILLKQGKYDEAEKKSLETLSFFLELNDSEAVLTLYELLYETYKARSFENADFSDAEKFISYFSKYHELKDSLQSQERYKEFSELQTKYESEQKDKANLILESRVERQRLWVLSLSGGGVLLAILFIVSYRFYLERKKVAKQLSLDKETITKQAHKLQALDAFKSRFFANVSHDLRTPLTLIQGHIHQIKTRENYLHSKSEESLHKLEINANKLVYLTDEIKDLILLEDDKLILQYGQVEITGFLTRLVNQFSSAAAIKRINLQFNSLIERDFIVHIDPLQFEKVIYNLLANAIKFTAFNGNIAVHLDKNENEILIKIEDDGAGISKDKVQYIFSRYYQASNDINYSKEGIGVGLALVLELVKLHEGDIHVESELGNGSSFLIRLPFNLDKEVVNKAEGDSYLQRNKQPIIENETEAGKLIDVSENEKRKKGARTILIVDDHPDIRNYICELIYTDFIVRQASDGEEALSILNREKIDLVITDLMMPWMDGHELIEQMKVQKELATIPILVISARTTEEDQLKVLEKGINDFIAKPFQPHELKLRINNALIKNQSESNIWDSLASNNKKFSDVEKKFSAKINDVILSRIDDPKFTVQHIADELIMSRRSAFNIIQELSGMNPRDYITHIKFQYAMDLLKKKKVKSVTEVAQAIGMVNPTYFGNQFKKKMGVHPNDLIKVKD